MSAIYIECPSCGWEDKIDESLVGRRIKCPKCAASFVAEVGGTYDLADSAGAGSGGSRKRVPITPSRPAPDPKSPPKADDEPPPKSWLESWPEG